MPTGSPPAWNDQLLQNPHAVADKRSRVQQMFAAIAPKYDLNNRLHSFWRDQAWRRKAVRLASVKAGESIVDVACGTGDLTVRFARDLHAATGTSDRRQAPSHGQVVGVDFTYQMLPLARNKAAASNVVEERFALPSPRTHAIAWLNADATALPLRDACCDVVSIAFGIRNVDQPERALKEFRRILRPRGRVIVLEFSQPTNRLIRWCNDVYCTKIMPHTATWISGDKSGAYKYLPMSIKTFLSREKMVQMLADVGFADITQHPMTFGVCVCYRGYAR